MASSTSARFFQL
ncbi:hypothetical protein ECEC4203_1456, partial [Escherichia coli EC4203]